MLDRPCQWLRCPSTAGAWPAPRGNSHRRLPGTHKGRHRQWSRQRGRVLANRHPLCRGDDQGIYKAMASRISSLAPDSLPRGRRQSIEPPRTSESASRAACLSPTRSKRRPGPPTAGGGDFRYEEHGYAMKLGSECSNALNALANSGISRRKNTKHPKFELAAPFAPFQPSPAADAWLNNSNRLRSRVDTLGPVAPSHNHHCLGHPVADKFPQAGPDKDTDDDVPVVLWDVQVSI